MQKPIAWINAAATQGAGLCMETRQIACFLCACDVGSIAAAAERLGTVQSSISLQITQLEGELGVELCRRGNTGLSLTRAGEQFYRVARGLTAEVEFVSRYARSSLAHKPSRIALAVPVAPRGSAMAETLRRLARTLGSRHPHVSLRIVDLVAGATTMADDVKALVETRVGAARSMRRDVRDRWGFVTRRGETEFPGGELSLGDLSELTARLRVVLPKLPSTIALQAEHFACAVGMTLAPHDIAVSDLDHVNFGSNDAVLLPLSCLPGFSQQQRFQVSYAQTHPSDLLWEIQSVGGTDDPIVDEIAQMFGPMLRDALPSRRETVSCVPSDNRGSAGPRGAESDEPLSLRQLKAFDAAFDRGNVSRAAADLNVSQPALSNTLKKLEGVIGHKLFARTVQGILPNDRAVVLRSLCEPVLQDLAQARRQIRDFGTKGFAPLRVGLLPVLDDKSLLAVTVADTIHEWSLASARCELQLMEGYSASLRRLTIQDLLDVAVVDNDVRQSGLLVTPLSRDSIVVVTNPHLGVLPPGHVKASDVPRLKLILPSERHGLRGIIQRAFAEAGMTITPTLELDSMAMTLNLIKMDNWATLLPVSAIFRRAQAKELQINLITDPTVDRGLSLVQRSGAKPSSNAVRFIEILAARIRDAVASQQNLV